MAPLYLKTQAIQQLIAELGMLLQESAQYHQLNSPLGSLLHKGVAELTAFQREIEVLGERFVVAFVGRGNIGKSTLVNALFGRLLVPTRNGPCTAAPVEFAAGSGMKIEIHYRGHIQTKIIACDSADHLRTELKWLVDDPRGDSSQVIERVVVYMEHPLLEREVVISDTPGYGAAQGDNESHSHELALNQYLKSNAAQVLWVIQAGALPGKEDFEFYRRVLADRCSLIIATAADGFDDKQKREVCKTLEVSLGPLAPEIRFVSGKKGLRARTSGNHAELEESGIIALLDCLQEIAAPVRRIGTLEVRLAGFVESLVERIKSTPRSSQLGGELVWRSDSWYRWADWRPLTTAAELHEKIVRSLAQITAKSSA